MVDMELAKSLIYTQRAMRLAQNGVENVASTSAQLAAEEVPSLTLQQRVKQFDAFRREQWQQHVEVIDDFDRFWTSAASKRKKVRGFI